MAPKKREPARSRRQTLAEKRKLRNRPRFEGREFPCPICHEPETVQIDARGAPYVACGDCGVQLFIRSDSGADRLDSLIRRGPGAAPPPPVPRTLRAGQTVLIFHDPLTREHPEAYAVLVERLSVDDATGIERWRVQFDDVLFNATAERKILRQTGGAVDDNPRPVAPAPGEAGGQRSPKTAAHVLSRAARRDRR